MVRVMALVRLFIKKLKKRVNARYHSNLGTSELPAQFKSSNDKYLVTQGDLCQQGLVVSLEDDLLLDALNYFYKKATLEIKRFLPKNSYKKISEEKNDVLFYTGRILPSQEIDGKLHLSDVCLDLTTSSFCVPLVEKNSPLAYAIINEVHWHDPDACHSGNETVLRHVLKVAFVMEGRSLVKNFRINCARCRYLNKKAVEVAMGPVSECNLCVAPAFFNSQVDITGPFSSYSISNKRATIKIWFAIFCCCTTGAVDVKVMEDYSTSSFVLAFIRFSCKVGFPKKLLPDAGSQLLKACDSMTLVYTDIKHKLHTEFGVEFDTCPVGAHYMHGKVERKVKHVKESLAKSLQNHRLSIIQWESLGDQIANSINNLPIAIGNVVKDLENLDILTPNRLMLARNNSRCPAGAVLVSDDPKRIIQSNNEVFTTWFQSWLISYVPTLMPQPKWFHSSADIHVGDVILFLKSDKEFEKLYQYGIIQSLKHSKDGLVRAVVIEYQNNNENVKRLTTRGVREIVVIHPVDELGLVRELNNLYLD